MSRASEALLTAWASDGAAARVLAPLGWVYGGLMRVRNAAYDVGMLRRTATGVPTISIGNRSVGGTGKTPVSAWVADAIRARGGRPGIVLRGYGDDEPEVHRRLVPDAVVVADPDRVRGAARAVAAGATAIVLDDAFQHRRVARDLDVVLVAAEWVGSARCLPAGPWREPVAGLARADLLLVTRRTASADAAAALAASLSARWGVSSAVAYLAPGEVRAVEGPAVLPSAGQRILAVSGIGAPGAFADQLRRSGAVVDAMPFPDHHAYTPADVRAIVARAEGTTAVVCTLKDAVKLASLWPAGAPGLWYLSHTVRFEVGEAVLTAALDRMSPVR